MNRILTTGAFLASCLLAQTPAVDVAKPQVTVEKPSIKRGKFATPDLAATKALSIPNGSTVNVKTSSGAKLKGTLLGMTGQAMTLRVLEGNRYVSKVIPFAEVAGLKKSGGLPKPGMPGLPGAPGVDAQFAGIPEGAPVTATLPDKSTVSGRFAGVNAEGVGIQVPGANGDMTLRRIPTDQISGLKQPKGKLPGMPNLQSPAMVKKSLLGIPVGSPVTLNMPGGAPLTGKLMGVDDKGFSLQTLEGGNLVTKELGFDQVGSVKMPGFGVKGLIPGLRPPGLQTPEAIKARALNVPVGSPLTVNMPNGQKLSGKFMGATNEGLQIQGMQGGNLVTQTLPFDAVGSIKPGVPSTPSSRARGFGKQAISIVVTAAAAGIISGALSR